MPIFFQKIQTKFQHSLKNPHFKYGLPFLSFVFIGWYILQNTQACRFDLSNQGSLTRKELQAHGFNVPDSIAPIEEVYEEMKDIAKKDWENIRVPRPWEEEPSKN